MTPQRCSRCSGFMAPDPDVYAPSYVCLSCGRREYVTSLAPLAKPLSAPSTDTRRRHDRAVEARR